MDDQTKKMIQDHIDTNEVCLFMKGTPDAPQCGFSMAVSNMLKILEVNFKGINVLEDQSIREGIKTFSDWPTIPQLYVNKEFIGGCDIIKEMYESGELKKVFDDIKQTRNIKKIPNFWRAIANNPETLERTWNNLKQIMKKGELDPVTKELIYVAVSITNSCEYCIRSHTAAAKKKGASDQMIKEMIDVVGIANQNNKLVESYQVEVDKIYR